MGVGSIGGLGQGIDVQGLVSQILYAARAPERLLMGQKQTLQTQDSAYADLNSRLSDLLTKANALSTTSFSVQKATSSNNNIFTASADGTAQIGTYTVKVNSLATASTYSSNAFSSSTTALNLSGTLSLSVGSGAPQTVTVATTDTLSNIRDKINATGLALTASIITDTSGSRLSIIGNSTGTANAVNITGNTVTGLTLTQNTAAANASIVVNGISVSSASNTVTGAISGVTLNLVSADTVNTYNLSVANDGTAITNAINDFVNSYNNLNSFINSQFTYDSSKKTSGPLAGDSILRGIQSNLQNIINSQFSGNPTLKNLPSVGITFQRDGTLAVDNTVLGPSLTNNFSEVKNLFQSTSPSGIAVQLSAALTQATDPISGSVQNARNAIASTISSIDSNIANIEDRLLVRQQVLVAQFSRADAALRQLAALQAQISNSLGRPGS